MLVRVFYGIIFCGCLATCNNPNNKVYSEHVGDIEYDSKIDTSNFELCNVTKYRGNSFQYYSFSKGLQYSGEKIEIVNFFEDNYLMPEMTGESGYVTIRFIVNCHGQTGRFRVQEMNLNLTSRRFDERIVNKLYDLTILLDGWEIQKLEGTPVDYYQYLLFKIENGQLIEILP